MGRFSNWLFGAKMLLPLMRHAEQRRQLDDMRDFVRKLPLLVQQPMPTYMAQLGGGQTNGFSETTVRELADLASLLERRSPLGICMRRSLVRYHYLNDKRPLTVQFGARFDNKKTNRPIAGHAWVTHQDQPYYEDDENWKNFVVIYSWPQANETN